MTEVEGWVSAGRYFCVCVFQFFCELLKRFGVSTGSVRVAVNGVNIGEADFNVVSLAVLVINMFKGIHAH